MDSTYKTYSVVVPQPPQVGQPVIGALRYLEGDLVSTPVTVTEKFPNRPDLFWAKTMNNSIVVCHVA